MTINYNTALVGSTPLFAMTFVGIIFLGIGMAANGHMWQVIVGSSLGGIGILSSGGALSYIFIPRNFETTQEAMKKDAKTRIWAYATQAGNSVLVGKNSQSDVVPIKPNTDPSALKKSYTRVIVPLFF